MKIAALFSCERPLINRQEQMKAQTSLAASLESWGGHPEVAEMPARPAAFLALVCVIPAMANLLARLCPTCWLSPSSMSWWCRLSGCWVGVLGDRQCLLRWEHGAALLSQDTRCPSYSSKGLQASSREGATQDPVSLVQRAGGCWSRPPSSPPNPDPWHRGSEQAAGPATSHPGR